MKKLINKALVAGVVVLGFVNAAVCAEAGMEKMDTPEFREFYVASKFSLPVTKKVYLADISVSFSDKWEKAYLAETGRHYQETIKDLYAETLKSELSDAMTEKGWTLVSEKSQDTIVLRAKLIDLYIYSPNKIALDTHIVKSAGAAGIELIYETPTGTPFMKMVDHRRTRDSVGSPLIANRVNNLRYFKMLMDSWSESAAMYLSEIMITVESQSKS